MRTTRIVFGTLFLLACGSISMAQIVVRATLSGADEVPPVPSNATGQAIFVVYPDRIDYNFSGTGVGTEVQAAHIHLGFPGVAGPVIVPLFDNDAGAFPGRVTGSLFATDFVAVPDRGVSTFADVQNAILGGRTYINIHTTLSPPGEIRGQLLQGDEQRF
jgi:hypothetical protein